MQATDSDKDKLLVAIREPVSILLELISPLKVGEINQPPAAHSWTAGELFNHIIKSTTLVNSLLLTPGAQADRNISARIPELKETFLDFLHKMKSPDEIVPDKGPHKKSIAAELDNMFEKFFSISQSANSAELVEKTPFGPATKWEIMHFVLYHTERHLHQMRKIVAALK